MHPLNRFQLENERISDVRNNSFGDILNSLTFTSRPDTKWILGINYEIGKFGFSLNNTYFGKTTFNQDGLDENLKTEFIPKIVTDLSIGYKLSKSWRFSTTSKGAPARIA